MTSTEITATSPYHCSGRDARHAGGAVVANEIPEQALVGDEGFWRLTQDHLSALLARNDLSWESVRVYLALAYLTIGFRKTKDRVSIGQIAELAHIEHRNVIRALGRLKATGLYDEKKTGPRCVIRWPIWPAPKGPGRKPRFRAEKKPPTGLTPPAEGPSTEAGSVFAESVSGSGKADTSDSVNDGVNQDTLPETQKKNRDPLSLRERSRRKDTPADPRVKAFIDWFSSEYHKARGKAYIVHWGKDGALVKRLLQSLAVNGQDPVQELRTAAQAMLADPWGKERADIGLLSSQINRWRGGGRSRSPGRPATFTPAISETNYGAHAKDFGQGAKT